MPLDQFFPQLVHTGYQIMSPRSTEYNCIAWAAGEQDRWWWPDDNNIYYWPTDAPREETMPAFITAYQTLGFAPCDDATLEPGSEKVAIYALAGKPTHVARQLSDGRWISKLGNCEDIEHTLDGLTGQVYGEVAQILRRPRQ
jgi:hypothetical protein